MYIHARFGCKRYNQSYLLPVVKRNGWTMVYFPRTPNPNPMPDKSNLSAVAVRIDNVLTALGLNPSEARLAETFTWQFQRGTALIEMRLIQEDGGGTFFQISAPIMHLPHDNVLFLYRRLLELNMQLVGAAFAIYRDVVYLVDERPVPGLDDDEAHAMINTVAGFADQLDDSLVEEFGGRLYGQI